MWKKRRKERIKGNQAELRMQMHSKPKARARHVSAAAGAQSCILLGWSNARRFSRRSFIGCHIVSGFICIVKRPRRADIATTHSPTNTQQEERILFLTRARAVLARACSKGCSRRVEFSLSSPPSLSPFHEGGFLCRRIFMHRALSACCDRSIATHEGIRAPRDIANLSRFVLALHAAKRIETVNVSWVGFGRRRSPSGLIWITLSINSKLFIRV